MNRLQSAYAVLGISPGATAAEVKKAYRGLVRRWHPDRFTNDPARQHLALEMLKSINEAYEQLLADCSARKFNPDARTCKDVQTETAPSPVKRSPVREPPSKSAPRAADSPAASLFASFTPWRYLALAAVVIALISAGIAMIDSISYRKAMHEASRYDNGLSAEPAGVGTRYGGALQGLPAGGDLSGPRIVSPGGPNPPKDPYVEAPSAPIVPQAPSAPVAPVAAPAR